MVIGNKKITVKLLTHCHDIYTLNVVFFHFLKSKQNKKNINIH